MSLLLGGWVPTVLTSTSGLDAGLPPLARTISDCVQPDVPRPGVGEGDWFTRREDVPGGFDVVAVGVPADEADRLLHGARTHPLSPDAEPVPVSTLAERRPLPDDVTVIGYEVVGLEHGSFHTWLCYDYAGQVLALPGLRLTDHALFTEEADARRARDLILDDGETPEDVTWAVVALARPQEMR